MGRYRRDASGILARNLWQTLTMMYLVPLLIASPGCCGNGQTRPEPEGQLDQACSLLRELNELDSEFGGRARRDPHYDIPGEIAFAQTKLHKDIAHLGFVAIRSEGGRFELYSPVRPCNKSQ
jgi:hypothetical protein